MAGNARLMRAAVCAGAMVVGVMSSVSHAGKPGGSGPPPVPVRYSIVFLDSYGGQNEAGGMNDYGDVVGRTVLPGEDTVFLLIDGLMLDLNTVVDPALNIRLAQAYDVSDNGRVAGYGSRYDANGNYLETFVYRLAPDADSDGYVEIEQLGVADPTHYVPYSVFGINDDGDVCGYASNALGSSAFVYTTEAGFIDIGTLDGISAVPRAINNRVNGQLQVAGTSGDRGFRYTGDAYGNGMMQNLGTLWTSNRFRDDSAAFDINSLGDVVGFAQVSKDDQFAARYRNGKWTSLGSLVTTSSWNDSEASDINDAGHVVGFSLFGTVPLKRSFLYVDGYKMTELESLIDGLPADYVGQMELIEIANPAPGYQYGVICGRRTSDWSSFLLFPDR